MNAMLTALISNGVLGKNRKPQTINNTWRESFDFNLNLITQQFSILTFNNY